VTHGQALRIGQIGTRHGHAAGKWQALQSNPDVEAVGIWEPDPAARATAAALRTNGPFATASATPPSPRSAPVFGDAHWFDSESDLLNDASVLAVAIEGRNHESLAMALRAIEAGKHIWFDKPAGDDWPAFQQLMQAAAARELRVQMGYRFRYSGRPTRITTVLRNDATPELPTYSDNTSTVLEFEHALAVIDIAAMEPRPVARRFEVFGSRW
jgi:predicted dehydrogenase